MKNEPKNKPAFPDMGEIKQHKVDSNKEVEKLAPSVREKEKYIFLYYLGLKMLSVKTKIIEAFSIEEAVAKFKATARNSAKIVQITIIS